MFNSGIYLTETNSFREMPAVFSAKPPIEMSFDFFPGVSITAPGKRIYSYSDMEALTEEVGYVERHKLPKTTVDSWLKRSGLAKSSPRRKAYDQIDLVNFGLFCLCHSQYTNSHEANQIYQELTA
jgi:hypothetical protein